MQHNNSNDMCKITTFNLLALGILATFAGFYEEVYAVPVTAVNQETATNLIPVAGTVTDASGEPLIGVTVTVKGQKIYGVTDIDGNYSLSNVPKNATISFSYVGYTTLEEKVAGRGKVDVKLTENASVLNEVVVVGYGTAKKKDLTGSVGAVKGDDLAARHTMNLSTALQGALSGVTVTRSGSEPGAEAQIKVRGVTTIGDTNPLYIVDGVPGDINQVNPEDVESMTVLKDAASAAIYGSRAAAGVILITTKRAKEDKFSLNYNFEYGWEKPTRLPKFVGLTRFLEMVNELRYNDNPDGGWNQTYSQDDIDNWATYHETDPDHYPDFDWAGHALRKTAPRMTHSFQITGGSKKVKSLVSFRYDENGGLYAHRKYDRWQIRTNNDFDITKWLALHTDIQFSRAHDQKPNVDPMKLANRAIPRIYADKWTNGRWGDCKDGGNILAMLEDGGKDQKWMNIIRGRAAVDIKPVDGLIITGVVSPAYYFNNYKTFRKSVAYSKVDDPDHEIGYMSGFSTTALSQSRNANSDITWQAYANYVKDWGKHSMTLMVGYEGYHAEWDNMSASRDQFQLKDFPYLDLGSKDYMSNSGTAEAYSYQSIMARGTYNFDNRYLFQANLRHDGSSRFAKKHRWATFPSFSAGWIVSNESFFEKMNAPWFDYLKIRGSWGRLGNERLYKPNTTTANYYPYQASIGFGNVLLWDAGKQEIVTGTSGAQWQYAVNNITWETTESWDVGLDANFFNSRLRFTFDYYEKYTKDMLLPLHIPGYIGYDDPYVNAGRMNTRGWDLELSWQDKIGNVTYGVSFNLSDFKSKMGDMGGTQFLGDQVKMEGSEFNEWYGYLTDGLFLTQEDVDNSPKLNDAVKVGDVKYLDISGPEGVPDGKVSPEYDRVLLGGSLPRFTYGFSLNASWYGFDFNAMFQGVGRQNSRITNYMVQPMPDNWGSFPVLIDGNSWSAKNTDEENANAKYPRYTNANFSSNMQMSDYWLFKAHYFRCKNITLGYTLPQKLTRKFFVERLRVYVAANDLFSIDNYPKGWDPEASNTGGYPVNKSFMFGINIQF